MDEKIIIESRVNKVLKVIFVVLPIISTVLSFIGLLLLKSEIDRFPNTDPLGSGFFWLGLVAGIIAICFWICFARLCGSKITVTNKRVYGCSAFGKKVDLPMDLISAVATSATFNVICVATSAGQIKFYLVSNYSEIHHELSVLISARQKEPATVINPMKTESGADEIKKYKELLDQGIITQEEFDAKKKQLLGL